MNLKINDFDHFSFDLWLTLIKSNPEFKNKRSELFREFFEIELPIEEVIKVVRKFDVLCNTINERTGFNINTFEIYCLILNELKIDMMTINSDRLQDFYEETESLFMEYKPVLLNTAIHTLFDDIVRQEKTINILSNTGFIKGNTLRKLLSYYDLEHYFSFQIYSDEVEYSKPNKEIYSLVYTKANENKSIVKNKIIHIGDNYISDYTGALNFGFNAFLYEK
ncbi:HAD family hydrolase [Aquimarina longa]|uniref:HAD family hydrolase n=1 Tax=Aquimarina longa TaxID=1080221 RepID=UPI000A78B8CC|nr:HAD family hydrolase [Aquimarina longa]